ncbi:MAG: hypothetical protein IJ024_00105 [Lachnospiraceae bacterium]|nr:hypothetical protein [Lachnospiraceae bacterium]
MPSAGFNSFGGIMNVQIMVGGIRFRFDSDFEIIVEESLSPFLCTEKNHFDVNVKVMCDGKKEDKPLVQMSGEDLLLEYYQQDNQMLCLAKGGVGGYLSTVICNSAFSDLECHLHFQPVGAMRNLGNLLRLLPMCMLLQQKEVLFFHSAQIEIAGKGILFTAPSGTGKTTHAKLWRKYRGARIICNDRTLIRGEKTYGYPVDGSEPVGSGEILTLGTVVFLEQAPLNEVRRLCPKEALLKLLPQLVIAAWDPNVRVLAMEQLISLIKTCPVYLLRCTPEESAVQCLERQLKLDGVI